jgi:hypothetical protein
MNIRFIKNVKATVITADGNEQERKFMFGERYEADQVEVVEEGYVTILLSDGTTIPGITSDVIENYGVPVVASSSTAPTTQEVEELESETEPEDTVIPVDGTMLGNEG